MEEAPKLATESVGKSSTITVALISALISGIIFGLLGYLLRDSMVMVDKGLNSGTAEVKVKDDDKEDKSDDDSTVGKVERNLCIQEKNEIISLVKTFEKFQEDRKAEDVLALFTNPVSTEEMEDYNQLKGEGISYPRLYQVSSYNYNTESYKLLTDPSGDEDICSVDVEEMRSYYGGPADPEFQAAKKLSFRVSMKKVDNAWLVDSYNSLDSTILEGKYSGFMMTYK